MLSTARMILVAALLAVCAWARPALADPPLAREIRDATVRIEALPQDVGLRLARADLLRRAERFEEALGDVRVAEAVAPGEPRLALARGEILDDAGRRREAVALFEAFVATRPPSGLAFVAWVRLARAAVREARVDDAVRAYDEALDARGDVQIYVERAALLERNGRADEAVEGLLAGVHELAGAVVLREELVRLLSATGRRGDALEHANMLVRDADVPARALLLRAGVLDALGRAREARADRERALSEAEAMVARRPSARAVYLRGAALLSLGRIDEARRDLAVAVRRAPHMTEAREALARAERTGGRR